VLEQDQVRGLQRQRQRVAELVGAPGRAAGDHELPDAEVLEIDRVPGAVFLEGGADVDLVVDPVGLLLLEVVRVHLLRGPSSRSM